MESSPTGTLFEILERQRAAFVADMNPSIVVRQGRLDRLALMNEKHATRIIEAIDADFGHRSAHETRMAELVLMGATIRHTRRHLKTWMKARRGPTNWRW